MAYKELIVTAAAVSLAMTGAQAFAGSGTTATIGVDATVIELSAPAMGAGHFRALAASRWDENGDGVISRAEWNAAAPAWFGPARAGRTFGLWDANHDGVLDARELRAGFNVSPWLFSRFDLNRDGVIDALEAVRVPRGRR